VLYGANLSVNAGRTHVAAGLIAEAAEAGLVLSVFSYAVLLKGYGRAGNGKAVDRTLEVMRREGVLFDNVTFNSAVDAYIRCGNVPAARKLVDDDEYRVLRDTRTFNILLKGLSRKGLVQEAYAVRDEIVAAGLEPNEVTQNTLVDACVRAGDFDAALRLAQEVQPGPGSVRGARPDQYNQLTIALSQILAGLAEAGKLDDATRLLEEMTRRGAPPNQITYSALITACLRHSDVARAERLFESQEARTGMPPTLHIYNAMITGLCKAGNEFYVDSAVRMLRGMREAAGGALLMSPAGEEGAQMEGWVPSRRRRGAVAPSDATYNSVIDGLVCFSRVHDAEDVFEWMREDGVTPSVITYTTLIKGWSAERNLAEARRVFRYMTRDGVAPDAPAYNALINACVRVDNDAAAENILTLMEDGTGDADIASGVYSYSPLIALHSRRGNLKAVWDVYQRGRRHGMAVNKYLGSMVVNAIINLGTSLARHGQLAERRVIADMAASILDDAWDDCRDKHVTRVWRRRLLGMFVNDAELSSLVAHAGGGGALKSASEVIFEKHGWNDISSGWRPL
jgi:pentatricopeptide repeat protein